MFPVRWHSRHLVAVFDSSDRYFSGAARMSSTVRAGFTTLVDGRVVAVDDNDPHAVSQSPIEIRLAVSCVA